MSKRNLQQKNLFFDLKFQLTGGGQCVNGFSSCVLPTRKYTSTNQVQQSIAYMITCCCNLDLDILFKYKTPKIIENIKMRGIINLRVIYKNISPIVQI